MQPQIYSMKLGMYGYLGGSKFQNHTRKWNKHHSKRKRQSKYKVKNNDIPFNKVSI